MALHIARRPLPLARPPPLPIVLLLCLCTLGSVLAEKETYQPECDVNDPLSCSQQKHEVCLFLGGAYKCACPAGYGRLPDGRCLVINECANPKLHECPPEANCIDQAEGYMCRCKPSYADASPPNARQGTVCKKQQNECGAPQTYGVDCDPNAACVDTSTGYECRCRPGFTDISESFGQLPGRKCVVTVNECEDPDKNDCSENAACIDAKESYTCVCHPGFVDASANVGKYPGRVCNKPEVRPNPPAQQDQCDPNRPNSCPAGQVCRQQAGGHSACQCAEGSALVDGRCQMIAACQVDPECDKNANCINVLGSYSCQCKPGFFDVDPVTPGRECKELANECADRHDCSPHAKCVDNRDGYECTCAEGFTDVSSAFGLGPGRKCVNSSNECAERALHTCDDNADCIDTPQGYSCQCFAGYVDVSSNAHLPPGRVCTVQTSCPKQRTDLIFLIDGSGSIGSQAFRNEVLRFIKNFIELFDIGLDNTRVGLIQYSDQIRHEFNMNQYADKRSLLAAVDQTEYLTGLTRTGAAIQHMVSEGFSERRGVRPLSEGANRVAVVITDGRSQDNVTQPSNAARSHQVTMFAIGVTDHVSTAELENIAGSPNRWFFVEGFKDLDMRLRSLIQKLACPAPPHMPHSAIGGCNPDSQTGCDRALGQICVLASGGPVCQCPAEFPPHPKTKVCGGDLCNPEVATSCPYPEVCRRTPLGNFRCVCSSNYVRDSRTGVCISTQAPLPPAPACPPGKVLNARAGRHCLVPGACDPADPNSCDLRKRERCLPAPKGQQQQQHPPTEKDETYETRHQLHRYLSSQAPDFTCQCVAGENRHPVTGICLRNECENPRDNDCARPPAGRCIDTDEGYICMCSPGFLDSSLDAVRKAGRVCVAQQNECADGTHHCSPNAICYDTPESYVCRCKPGFVDFSPNPQHESGIDCRPLRNECLDGTHTCSPDAICYDTADSYKCICKPGFKDADELRNPGRNCQKIQEQRNPCQEGTHNCHPYARCRPTGALSYTCECVPEYEDKSPPGQPGRVCVPKQPICLDRDRIDCHPEAICQETNQFPEGFTCRCRDGYLDKSVDRERKPGRDCQEMKNECLDRSLNDCDSIAVCKDLAEGYTCVCPPNSVDQSPPGKPGRSCRPLKNECLNPAENNCSRYAECTDKEEGYQCACRPGFRDENPAQPGTVCSQIINECNFATMNDCSRHAKCIDQQDGYTCECIPPFVDEGPRERPGRVCLFNECASPKDYDCDKSNAICVDLTEGYTCKCKEGFYDDLGQHKLPGRVCLEFAEQEPPTHVANETRIPTCGDSDCDEALGEVCVGGTQCLCKPGFGRARPTDKCEALELTPLTFRVISAANRPLVFSSAEYGTSSSAGYVQFADTFAQDLGRAVSTTTYAQRYILTDVNYITHPKTVNQSWTDGLLVNFTVGTRPTGTPVDVCDLWNQLMESLHKTNGAIGGGKLNVAADNELLSPCPPPKDLCGGLVCRPELGEVCVNGEFCACPPGQKRAGTDDICRIVESWTFPLWVIRKNQYTLECNDSFANPLDSVYKQYVDSFQSGVRQSYVQTPMRNAFVANEVNDIVCPSTLNGTWEHGVIFNATYFYRVGVVPKPQDAYNTLVRWIIDRNNQQVGQSGLYLNPYQPNPFSPCFKNDCHPKGLCVETGPNSYRCECAQGFRDMLAANPGHDCVPTRGINECENKTLNECSANARCIDLEYLYRCECLPGFSDASPKGQIPGSVCTTDYCSDVNFCPVNSTCVNQEHQVGPELLEGNGPIFRQAFCHCKPGYVDLRDNVSDAVRVSAGYLQDQFCLFAVDVNECLLGLHNCSDAAVCIDLRVGYTCACLANYTDENPSLPGRACGIAAALADLGSSTIPFILFLILALLFLLLTLCCCLYLLSRLRWFKKQRAAWADGSASDESLYGRALTIPRAKLDEDMGSLASSEYTIREEIERRVTTEVTRTEEEVVGGETTYEEHEQVGDRQHTFSQSHAAEFHGGGGGMGAIAGAGHH